MYRPPPKASLTDPLFTVSPLFRSEAELAPTRAAKAVIGLGHRPAAGAARRQRPPHSPAEHARYPHQAPHALLSPKRRGGTSAAVDRPDIFDRHRRPVRRDRAAPHFSDYDFVRAQLTAGIADRLAPVKRTFAAVPALGVFAARATPPQHPPP